MSKSTSRSKRLVYVSEDLVEKVLEVAKRRGESISKFVEEAVESALRASHVGYSPKEVAELLEVLRAHRALGGAFIPQEVLNYLIEVACELNEERLLAKFYESGLLYGKYLKLRFRDPLRALMIFLGATRWDLNEVEVESEDGNVKLRCISTVLTMRATKLLASFVEGVVMGLGYQVQRKEISKGVLFVEFK